MKEDLEDSKCANRTIETIKDNERCKISGHNVSRFMPSFISYVSREKIF